LHTKTVNYNSVVSERTSLRIPATDHTFISLFKHKSFGRHTTKLCIYTALRVNAHHFCSDWLPVFKITALSLRK